MIFKKTTATKLFLIAFAILALSIGIFCFANPYKVKTVWDCVRPKIFGNRSVNDVLNLYEAKVARNLKDNAFVKENGFPKEILIFVNKSEKTLALFGRSDSNKNFGLVKSYPLTGFSGQLGPKLKNGDRQIPEGIYAVESLNPNSKFHLSLRVSYPNEFDKLHATKDGRQNLGSDIMIHGRTNTVGCVPIGDEAIEEVFVMSAQAGIKHVKVIIAPLNLLKNSEVKAIENAPSWYDELLASIKSEMQKYEKLGAKF